MDYLKQMEKALIFIENNLEQTIKVDEVAKISGYSYFHFHRVFESMFGETIGNYIRSRRLTKAAYELIYTERRIIDIAISLQFESHEAFSRAFKHYYKISPSQYRKNRIETLIGSRTPMSIPDIIHRHQNITLQPEIVELSPRNLVGLSFSYSFSLCMKMWNELQERINEITTIAPDMHRYGVFEANSDCTQSIFNNISIVQEFVGVEVTDTSLLPTGMTFKTLTGGKYAKFIHTGLTRDIDKTYQYIWGTWIPYGQVELDIRDDFECYTEKYLGGNNVHSEIEIFVPVK